MENSCVSAAHFSEPVYHETLRREKGRVLTGSQHCWATLDSIPEISLGWRLLVVFSVLLVGRRTVVNSQEYRQNRARFLLAELIRYNGQWVAFSRDGRRVIASNDDLAELDSLVMAAGEDPEQMAFERIELEDVYLGGAEIS
jgi:hypothetical protein